MNRHIGLPPFLFNSPDKKIIAWRFYYIWVSPQKNEHDDFSYPQKFIAYPQPHEILKCLKIQLTPPGFLKKESIEEILDTIAMKNPSVMLGYTNENQRAYKEMTRR